MNKPLVLVLLFVSSVAGANGFVGNGGDGVRIGEGIYLRDLVTRNLHENPYFGDAADPKLPLPSGDVMPFAYPRALLARKLTDLNAASPGLGDFLLGAMTAYVWVLQDFPLTRIPDPVDTVQPPFRDGVVQIANRFQSTIRLHRDSWERMNDAHKVALLIHEAVYSLVRPGGRAGHFSQSPVIAREITGSFFDPGFLRKPTPQILDFLSTELALPGTVLTLEQMRRPLRWEIIAFAGARPVVFDFSASPAGKQTLIENLCRAAWRNRPPAGTVDILSIIHRRPVSRSLERYRIADGSYQLAVAFFYNFDVADRSQIRSLSVSACIGDLNTEFTRTQQGLF